MKRFARPIALFLSLCGLFGCVASVRAQSPPANPPAVAPSPPQQDESEDDALRIGVELIQLDVIVTDKSGKTVEGLTRDDFELLENGKSQAIDFFREIRNGKSAPTGDAVGAAGAGGASGKGDFPLVPGRVFLIVVDDLHIATGNMLRVKQQLLKFVSDTMQPGDRIGLVTTSGRANIFQQLTANQRILRRAIDRLQPAQIVGSDPNDPARLTEYQAQQIVRGDPEALALGVRNYARATGSAVGAAAIVQASARQIARQVSYYTMATFGTMRNAIRALRNVPGRKAALLVSDGFLLESVEGNNTENLRNVVDAATRANVVIYSLGSAGLVALDPGGQDISQPGPIDLTGGTTRFASQSLQAGLDGLRAVAEETGGFAIVNNNDLLAGLKKIAADSETYYSLAYSPDQTQADGKFRKLSFRVKGRKDLQVRTQKGYFAPDAKAAEKIAKKERDKEAKRARNGEDPPSPEARDLNAALLSVVPREDVKIKATGSFVANLPEQKNVLMSFAVSLASLRFERVKEAHQTSLKTALLIVGEDGKPVVSEQDMVNLNFTDARYAEVKNEWFTFGKTLALKPGVYNIRFAVRDALDAKLGGTSEWIEVPNLEKSGLTAGDILFMNFGVPPGADKSQSPTLSVDPIQTAVRRFSPKSSLVYSVNIHNAPRTTAGDLAPVSAQTRLRSNGKIVYESPRATVKAKPDATGLLNYAVRVPLNGLPKGEYALEVEITADGVKTAAIQQRDFIIE
jgi:VWFA-related protein